MRRRHHPHCSALPLAAPLVLLLLATVACSTREPAASPDARARDGAGPVRDGGARRDVARRDAGFPCKLTADEDRDTILNRDEGCQSRLDTDKDGIPDYLDKDSDGDGISDAVEAGDRSTATPPIDSDKDGKPDFQDTDSDGNGVPDRTEGVGDLDGDGLADYADWDNDNDGISDKVEVGPNPKRPADSDGDRIPDYNDKDSDDNGIPDKVEGSGDIDGDKLGAYADSDNDVDKLSDRLEIGGTPAKPVDFDNDGVPDYNDKDSDGDGIGDIYEGSGDADRNGIPNRHDLDSDADGLLDSKEKGAAYPPPVDSDGDKTPDFLDTDSDNDGLSDRDEVRRGTSPTKADTDGDGASDLLETKDPRWDPKDPKKGPKATGDFVFVVGDRRPPVPAQATLSVGAGARRSDVVLLVDTTGSMGGEINNLRSSLSTIVTNTRKVLTDAAFGVARYQDFPTSPYGATRNVPFALEHRVMTASTPAGFASISGAVSRLTPTGGGDGPESGWEALYQLATGRGITAGGARVPAFSPATAYPATPVSGETVGTRGGAGFRAGSAPIVIWATDAANHDPGGFSKYTFSGAATAASALAELKKLRARVIGVLSGNDRQARADLLRAANATGAVVKPSAFGSGTARPVGCAATQCCTGINGAGAATDVRGLCPLVFSIAANGSGLGASVESGIKAIGTVTVSNVDVSARLVDLPGDAVDTVKAFLKEIRVRNVTSTSPPCTGGLTVGDLDPKGDGVKDTFIKVKGGVKLCFDIVARMNSTVRAATGKPLLFPARVDVYADRKSVIETRSIWFIVPQRP